TEIPATEIIIEKINNISWDHKLKLLEKKFEEQIMVLNRKINEIEDRMEKIIKETLDKMEEKVSEIVGKIDLLIATQTINIEKKIESILSVFQNVHSLEN